VAVPPPGRARTAPSIARRVARVRSETSGMLIINWLHWLLRAQEELVDDLHVKELCLSNHIDPNPVNSISRRILGTHTHTRRDAT
jgi:hypothetical protein